MTIYQQSQKVAAYALLPGIIPRLRTTFHSPFATLAALMADFLALAALLPPGHAYTRSDQFGNFGVLDVLRAGGARLRYEWRYIDQIIIYFALIAGTVTFAIFVVTALLSLGLGVALAAQTKPIPDHPNTLISTGALMQSIFGYMSTAKPDKDIALMLLDRTLGITGSAKSGSFFGSSVPTMCTGGDLGRSADPSCMNMAFPSAFNIATLKLLQFYSFAIFGFAILFFLYLTMTLVIEVSIKGKPFGERINSFWGPIRLVAAIGLLVPLSPHGLNSAQYIVLYTAKFSSAFATNGWNYYHDGMNAAMGLDNRNPIGSAAGKMNSGEPYSLLASRLSAPPTGDLVRFFHLVAACEYAYERDYLTQDKNINIQGYFYRPGKEPYPAYTELTGTVGPGSEFKFVPYRRESNTAVSSITALEYFDNSNIHIVFGHYDPIEYASIGGLKPLCGELVIPVTSITDDKNRTAKNPGAAIAQEYYYNYIFALLDNSNHMKQLIDGFARMAVDQYQYSGEAPACRWDTNKDPGKFINDPRTNDDLAELGPCNQMPGRDYFRYQIERFQSLFQALINASNYEQSKPEHFKIDQKILDHGWAGAGVWFQNIALTNGSYVSAVQQMPYGKEMPVVMSKLLSQILQAKPNISDPNKFCGLQGDDKSSLNGFEKKLSGTLCQINLYLQNENNNVCFIPDPAGKDGISGLPGYTQERCAKTQDNVVMKAINAALGTQFIFSFRDNADTHPLAQLVTFGRSLLETSARNLLTGSAIAAAGGVTSVGNEDISSALRKTSSFFITVASVLFSAGFMLYYVLPFLPFVYFFFAMLSWVKAIFEGLIGAPLWAASHLNLKGDGFSSPKARSGYLLLFEIFLRPIITVFSLLAAMAIFSATVYMLNDLLNPVLFNIGRPDLAAMISGRSSPEDLRGLLDVFFFTVLYILLIYMVAMGSFKLIDTIPNGFMRWFGGGAKSFAAEAYKRDTPSSTFTQNTYVAIGNPLQGLLDKTDEMVYEATEAGSKIINDQSKRKPEDAGTLATMVHSILGKDRKTRVAEAIGTATEKMSKEHATHSKDYKSLKEQIDNLKSSNEEQKENLEAELKFAEEMAKANDAELIYKELMKPGSTDLSKFGGDAKTAFEGNLATLRKSIEENHDIAWRMLQTKTEDQGGVYASRASVDKAFADTIKSSKDSVVKKTLAKLEKEGK